MPPKQATPEQEKQFRELLGQIGPVASMRIYSQWLSQEVQSGTHGPQFRDATQSVIAGLSDTAQSLESVR